MAPTDSEILINLVGQIPSSYSGSREIGSNIAIRATGDSYTRLQYLFQISKQTIHQVEPEVCQAIAEALMENIQGKKLCIVQSTLF